MENTREIEAGLLRRVQSGDTSAYFTLLAPHRERLYRKALSILGNSDDAEDALQEALLTAFRSIASFRGESSLYTWLYRIVVNKCYDMHRARKDTGTIDEGILIADDRISIEKNLELSEDSSYLIEKINGLEKKYRTILLLRYYDQLSYQEIAGIVKTNAGTVKSRLFKARELLKRSIMMDGKGDYFAERL